MCDTLAWRSKLSGVMPSQYAVAGVSHVKTKTTAVVAENCDGKNVTISVSEKLLVIISKTEKIVLKLLPIL